MSLAERRRHHGSPGLRFLLAAEVEGDAVVRGRGQDQLVTPRRLDFVAHRPEVELGDGLTEKITRRV